MAAEPVTAGEFLAILDARFSSDFQSLPVAAAVSGGPDSMALAGLLNETVSGPVHALIIDHGLREGSAEETGNTAEELKKLPNIKSVVLKWDAPKPEAAVQEEARKARYALMADYCGRHDIPCLFLGHHQDDQAETFLFRLAKGSGLDGLSGMRYSQGYSGNLTLFRPFLDIPKKRLVAACRSMGLDFISDPSNENEDYARARLRKSRAVLEEEGLSVKRLSTTARRLNRARVALDELASDAFETSILKINTKRIEFKNELLLNNPDEIVFRILLKAISFLRPAEDYLPRMEKLEDLLADFLSPAPFRKRTLGGLVFENDEKNGVFGIETE